MQVYISDNGQYTENEKFGINFYLVKMLLLSIHKYFMWGLVLNIWLSAEFHRHLMVFLIKMTKLLSPTYDPIV